MFNLMKFALSLKLTFNANKRQSFSKTIDWTSNGRPMKAEGGKSVTGWKFEIVNGIVRLGPFREYYANTLQGFQKVSGKEANRIHQHLLKTSEGYRESLPGFFKRGFLNLIEQPLMILSILLSIIGMALFAVIWVFWAITLFVAAIVAKQMLKAFIKKNFGVDLVI